MVLLLVALDVGIRRQSGAAPNESGDSPTGYARSACCWGTHDEEGEVTSVDDRSVKKFVPLLTCRTYLWLPASTPPSLSLWVPRALSLSGFSRPSSSWLVRGLATPAARLPGIVASGRLLGASLAARCAHARLLTGRKKQSPMHGVVAGVERTASNNRDRGLEVWQLGWGRP